jgi:stage II sporulation protein D
MTKVDGSWLAVVLDDSGATLAELPNASDLLIEPAEPATLLEMKFRDSLRSYDRYRGNMRLRVNGDGIMAVNIVGMNDYLRGVVPAEMPATWHMNAVRSQAIASRGYAYATLRTTGFHDVVPTSADQVYGGVNVEHSRSDAAVAETDRIVVTYNGRAVQTFFFALAGGHTEHNEYVFNVNSLGTAMGTPLAYLRGKPDLDPGGLPWDRGAPNYAWQSGSFSMSQLSAIMASDPETSDGTLISVAFDRGVSGRVYRATLVGTGGTRTVSGNAFKRVYNNHKLSGGNLRSNMYLLEQVP